MNTKQEIQQLNRDTQYIRGEREELVNELEGMNMNKARYKNPWFDSVSGHDPAVYETDAKPVSHDGLLIYNRIRGVQGRGCWDVVLNGVCIAQYAGSNCAPKVIERMKEKDYRDWLKEIGAEA